MDGRGVPRVLGFLIFRFFHNRRRLKFILFVTVLYPIKAILRIGHIHI